MKGAIYLAEIPVMLDGDEYIIGLTDYTPAIPGKTWGDPETCHPYEPAAYAYDLLKEDGEPYMGEYGERWEHAIDCAIDLHRSCD